MVGLYLKQQTQAYNLVIGSEAHRDVIKEICKRFFKASIYSDLECKEDKIDELADQLLHDPTNGIVILAYSESSPVGVLAALVTPLLFNHDRIASELVWWVDEEYRASGLGRELIDAFEYWGKEIAKVNHCQLSSLSSDDLGPYYEKRGYKFIEKAYLKTWQQ